MLTPGERERFDAIVEAEAQRDPYHRLGRAIGMTLAFVTGAAAVALMAGAAVLSVLACAGVITWGG